MLDEKLYTVADVARVTGMTSRTIRNYLKDGTLTGQKIGVQWRFTEDEVQKLFSRQQPGSSSPTQLVRSFLGRGECDATAVCVLVDLPGLTQSEGLEVFTRLREKAASGDLMISYEYHEAGSLFRIAVSGEFTAVTQLMEHFTQLQESSVEE